MYDRNAQTRATQQHRLPTDPTRPPRTTRGLAVCLALPVLVTVVAAAVTYPGVFGAAVVGLLAGAGGYHAVRRLVDRARARAQGPTRGKGPERRPATQ